MNKRIVAALLAIYPATWRKEYGPEFRHLLEALNLRVRTLVNVIGHGAWQRVRSTEPWLLLSLPLALVGTVFLAVLVIAPPPYDPGLDRSVSPPALDLLASLAINLTTIIGCGLWTILRSGGTIPHAGLQTMKMALLIRAPHLVVSLLVLTGILGVVVIGPGDSPTTFAERGFAIAFYSANGAIPNSPAIFWALLIEVLFGWIGGVIGGGLGRIFVYKPTPAG
jgi:hypothetical protein